MALSDLLHHLQTPRGISGEYIWYRAIGEYAEQGGTKDAKKLAEKFFQSVESFDFTLFQAKRTDKPIGPDSDKALEKAVDSINRWLLAAVALCLPSPSFT